MVGVDLVYLPEFETRMKNSTLEKVFLSTELYQNKSMESLGGIFAAKEAFFKAVGRKEDWLSVWIEKNKDGKPEIKSVLLENNQKAEVSISHAGDYAVAIVRIND